MLSFFFTHTPLKYLVEGLWRDEAFSYLLAKRSFWEILFLTVKDFNPPLYYFVLHMWMVVFGSSEIAMRSLSILFYAIGVFCVYEIFKVILNKSHRLTLVCISIFVLNPLVLYYAFEARMYSMLFCLAMASSFYYLKRDWRNYSIVTILGLFTHYFMLLVVLVQMMHMVLPLLYRKAHIVHFKDAVNVFIFPLAVFAPWVLFVAFQHTPTSQFWIGPLSSLEVAILPGITFSGMGRDYYSGPNLSVSALFRGMFGLFFICVTIVGWLHVYKKKMERHVYSYFVCLSFIPMMLVALISSIQPLYLPRYLIFVSASMSILLIFAVTEVKKPWRVFLLTVFILFCLQFHNMERQNRSPRRSTKAVIEKIKPLAKPGDVVYVTSVLDYMTAQYYFDERSVFLYNAKYEDIPSYVGKVLIPSSAIRNDYPLFPQKAFIIKDDTITYEIQSRFPL